MPENQLNSRKLTKQEMIRVAKVELKETSETRKNGLVQLKDWIANQGEDWSCINEVSDEFLLRFLRIKKMKAEKAREVLRRYIEFRTSKPEWFDMDISQDDKLNELIDSGYLFVLPERDANGRKVVFLRASSLSPVKYQLADIMRLFMLTYETLLVEEECQVNGITYIFDKAGTTWDHITMWTPTLASMAFGLAEGAIPISHKEVNLINLHWGMLLVCQFAKSLLSSKLRNRIHTTSLERVKSTIPEQILPKEYGGKIPVQEMVSEWKSVLESRRDQVLKLASLKFPEPVVEEDFILEKTGNKNSIVTNQEDQVNAELKGR